MQSDTNPDFRVLTTTLAFVAKIPSRGERRMISTPLPEVLRTNEGGSKVTDDRG